MSEIDFQLLQEKMMEKWKEFYNLQVELLIQKEDIWEQLQLTDHDKSEITLTQKYYAFGQFFKYIPFGHNIISDSGYSIDTLDRNRKKLISI